MKKNKSRMRNKALLLTFIGLLHITFSGCQGDNNNAPAGTGSQPSASAPNNSPQVKNKTCAQTLELAQLSDSETQSMKEACERHERCYETIADTLIAHAAPVTNDEIQRVLNEVVVH